MRKAYFMKFEKQDRLRGGDRMCVCCGSAALPATAAAWSCNPRCFTLFIMHLFVLGLWPNLLRTNVPCSKKINTSAT